MEHDEVHDRHSFIGYITQSRAELGDPARGWNWVSRDLPILLEATQAFVTDTKGAAPEANVWSHAAGFLMAAAVYG